MNKFELFTMVFFWLENFYKGTNDDKIKNQLSEMNPFLWTDVGSADPAIYCDYRAFIAERDITVENSLDIAKEYVNTIDYVDITEAFKDVDPAEWARGCEQYLSTEHKGSGDDKTGEEK